MRSAGLGSIYFVIFSPSSNLRMAWPYHQEKVSRRVCLDRMDETEIWTDCGSLLEPPNVRPTDATLHPTYLTSSSLITLFLYMVAELSALQQITTALTGMNGLAAVIVECTVTTIYTCTFLLTISPWPYV